VKIFGIRGAEIPHGIIADSMKNLYRGDSIPEAADREGGSAAIGDRWATAWNEGGLEALMPEFGVEYHPNYLGTFLRDLGLSYAKLQPQRTPRPDNCEESIGESDHDLRQAEREDSVEEGWIVDGATSADGE
jgi:transposase